MKRSHWILMLLCCLIPLAGIAAIVVFHIPATSVLYFGLVLMCPVLHLAMMGSMRHDHATTPSPDPHHPGPARPQEVERMPRGGTIPGGR